MQDAIQNPTAEFRGWLARIVHDNIRLEQARIYLRRFFTSWVEDDPDPDYSALDRADFDVQSANSV